MTITAAAVKDHARALGFDLCGIAPASDLPELARLQEWLDRGYAGEMVYLHKQAATRSDIRHFLPSARSVIVTGAVYYTGEPERPIDRASDAVHIARYARGQDYHVVLAERLEALIAWMREQSAEPFEAAVFVDKHHVQERVFAAHAGLGWIGKNTCVINPDLGSWFFIAGVAVSLDLPPDEPVFDQCGSCTLCIDSCPTGALLDDRQMDATRCISYLTIELGSGIPEAQRPGVGNHAFGCDICQEVCPWNLAPLPTADPSWQSQSGRGNARAVELWQRSDQALHAFLAHSAMTRTTVSRFRRNLAVAIGNSGDERLADVLDRPGGGVRGAAPSAEAPLVREHVEWAKRRLRG